MKHALLAVLAAGAATAVVAAPAQAETSLTIYGVADSGYAYQSYRLDRHGVDFHSRSSGTRDGMLYGNRWGLRGSEDLGGGLRAVFTMEQGFGLSTGMQAGGADKLFNRQAYVGLADDAWGRLTIGRQYSAGVNAFAADDAILTVDMLAGGVGVANRVSNAFKYTTPQLGGFQGELLYGAGDGGARHAWTNTAAGRTTLADRGNRLSVGGQYAQGPLKLGASYDRQGQGGAPTPGAGDRRAVVNWQLSASYDFEVVRASLAFLQDRNGKLGWTGSADDMAGLGAAPQPLAQVLANPVEVDGFRSNTYHVGLTAPLSGGRVGLFYDQSSSNLDDDSRLGDVFAPVRSVQLTYLLPLSQRTTIYAYGLHTRNLGYVRGLDGTQAGLGLSHRF